MASLTVDRELLLLEQKALTNEPGRDESQQQGHSCHQRDRDKCHFHGQFYCIVLLPVEEDQRSKIIMKNYATDFKGKPLRCKAKT